MPLFMYEADTWTWTKHILAAEMPSKNRKKHQTGQNKK
jgi:hypothetical protein